MLLKNTEHICTRTMLPMKRLVVRLKQPQKNMVKTWLWLRSESFGFPKSKRAETENIFGKGAWGQSPTEAETFIFFEN